MAQDGVAGIAPVGKYPANPFGLYDMAGNVAEWCGDWYAEDFYQGAANDNPTGPTAGQDRVVRGGSFDYSPRGPPSATRYRYVPGSLVDDVGLRVARSIERP